MVFVPHSWTCMTWVTETNLLKRQSQRGGTLSTDTLGRFPWPRWGQPTRTQKLLHWLQYDITGRNAHVGVYMNDSQSRVVQPR